MACGYIYCVSAQFKDAKTKKEFRDKICNFFKDEIGEKCKIKQEDIRVWDWSDIVGFLRESTRISDDWLGISLNELEDYGTYRDRIKTTTNFDSFLFKEKVDFIEPNKDEPFHPFKIFECLSNGKNIVLRGIGGVGKTRTMLEVANIAFEKKWRVLRLYSSGKDFNANSVMSELLKSSTHTLMFIDDIDQLNGFDIKRWKDFLLSEAAKRNIHVSILTNTRPGVSQRLEKICKSDMFSIIEISPSIEQKQQIIQQNIALLAPNAVGKFGVSKMQKSCGSRPIIAMFIAQEIEKKITNGVRITSLHCNDLSKWIIDGFNGNELLSSDTCSKFELPPISPIICAVTAAFACCPLTEEEVTKVVAATLGQLNVEKFTAKKIVGVLKNGGWLEENIESMTGEVYLYPPHNMITDEIFRHALITYPICDYPDIMTVLFAGAGDGWSLGHFAISLCRLTNKFKDLSIQKLIQIWLNTESNILLERLNQVEPYIAIYALGEMFDCLPSKDAMAIIWPQLIAPWLITNGNAEHYEAYKLLFYGLSNFEANQEKKLLTMSFDWINSNINIEDNPTPEGVCYILALLLRKPENQLNGLNDKLITLSIDWLDKFLGHEEGDILIVALINKLIDNELNDNKAAVLKQITNWLSIAPDDKIYIICKCLFMVPYEYLGETYDKVLDIIVEWLKINYTKNTAYDIINPLLYFWYSDLKGREHELLKLIKKWLVIGQPESMLVNIFLNLTKNPFFVEILKQEPCLAHLLQDFSE